MKINKFILGLIISLLLIGLAYGQTSAGGGEGIVTTPSAGGGGGVAVPTTAGGGGGGGTVTTPTTGGGGVITTPVSTVYSKTCTYIWDSTPYVNQVVEIKAIIGDETGLTASDLITVEIIDLIKEGMVRSERGMKALDGRTLDIQITEPTSNLLEAGAVRIEVEAKGPSELGDIVLSFNEATVIISNKNCIFTVSEGVAAAPGGGGVAVPAPRAEEPGAGASVCEKYYICPDGTEVQYCFVHKIYSEDGEITGVGCGCKNPRSLCEEDVMPVVEEEVMPVVEEEVMPVVEEEVMPVAIPPGAGTNENPIFCGGCILGNKCTPLGYRHEGKYCNIDSEFKEQKLSEKSCDNNFECKSNVCVDGECISGGLLRRILNWLIKLFG